MLQNARALNDAAFVTVRENDYRNHFWCMTIVEAVSMTNIADLSEKSGQL